MPKTKYVKTKPPKFTQWGDPILHSPTIVIPKDAMTKPEFKRLVAKMFRYLEGSKIGVGLAANQINIPLKLAVIEFKLNKPEKGFESIPRTVIVNPKITHYSKSKVGVWEGCLSCKGAMFWIERSANIEVTYFDEKNKKITRKINGFEAVIFQHEIDHLNGIVCGERTATKGGKVMPEAIVSNTWNLYHPYSIPRAVNRSVRPIMRKRRA